MCLVSLFELRTHATNIAGDGLRDTDRLSRLGHAAGVDVPLELTVPAVRPGAVCYVQYRFVCAMITLSGDGARHSVWSSNPRADST